MALALLAPLLAAGGRAAAKPSEPGDGAARSCHAIEVEMQNGQLRAVRLLDENYAIAHPRRFGADAALWLVARGFGCDAARTLMTRVLPAADEAVALAAAGWRVTSVQELRIDGVELHQLSAVRGARSLTHVRPGSSVRVGGAVLRPGVTLGFPLTPSTCTAGLPMRMPAPSHGLVGLTAGDCNVDGMAPDGSRAGAETPGHFWVSGGGKHRDPLGPVLLNGGLSEAAPDVLAYSLGGTAAASQEIVHAGGSRYHVVGILPICVDAHSQHGDGGGPVYTRPNADGEVRAAGLLARSSLRGLTRDMCYLPIEDVLSYPSGELPTSASTLPRPATGRHVASAARRARSATKLPCYGGFEIDTLRLRVKPRHCLQFVNNEPFHAGEVNLTKIRWHQWNRHRATATARWIYYTTGGGVNRKSVRLRAYKPLFYCTRFFTRLRVGWKANGRHHHLTLTPPYPPGGCE